MVCANCGIAEVDDIKMKDCDGCDLVKYCGDGCRELHRPEHEEDKKRGLELHDIDLFRQPGSSYHGNCPLCFLPLSLNPRKSMMKACCSKLICDGCAYADYKINGGLLCPFCREPSVDYLSNDEEIRKKMMIKRIKAGDPVAMCQLGVMCRRDGDYDSAVKPLTNAAKLGDAAAHCVLGTMYKKGEGFNADAEEVRAHPEIVAAVFSAFNYNPTGQRVEKDTKKAIYHLEKAAMGGHPDARLELARDDMENGNIERAVKHLIIAANLGDEGSMKELWAHYSKGNISKEDLDATLRTHHAAINEMKSPERDEAEAEVAMVNRI